MIKSNKEVRFILNWYLPKIRKTFKTEIRSIILSGSAVLDDFTPTWSDVDICFVFHNDIKKEHFEQIKKINKSFDKDFNIRSWKSGQFIEGYFISSNYLLNKKAEDQYINFSGSYTEISFGKALNAVEKYQLSQFGKFLYGEKLDIETPEKKYIIKQIHNELKMNFNDIEIDNKSAIYLTGIWHWLARSIVFLRDRKYLSKSDALKHEIKTNSQFKDIFKLSLKLRKKGSKTTYKYLNQLKNLYTIHHTNVCSIMNKLIKNSYTQI